jgi:IS5 family transposase
LEFQIFNAKKAEKEALYPQLLALVRIVLKQVDKALLQFKTGSATNPQTQRWIKDVEHYQALTLKVVDQKVRRVIDKESLPSSGKIISLFEEHSDIIVKGYRDIQHGHKINLSTEKHGLIIFCRLKRATLRITTYFCQHLMLIRKT